MATQKQQKIDQEINKKIWKIVGVLVAVFVVFCAGLVAWLSYTGSPKEIVAVADQFQPGPEWKLASEFVRPPKNFCIDVTCPSVTREWTSSKPITRPEFEALIRKTNWNLRFEDRCFNPDRDTPETSCWAHGIVDSYKVILYIINKDSVTSKPSLNLRVEENS